MSESLDIIVQSSELVDYINRDIYNSSTLNKCVDRQIPIFDVIVFVVVHCFDCWDSLDDFVSDILYDLDLNESSDKHCEITFLVEGLASEIISSTAKYLHGLIGLWIDSWEGDFSFEQEDSDDAFFNIHVDAVTMHNSKQRDNLLGVAP